MAVPGHDSRDFEFAQKFGLDIKQVVAPAGGDPSGNGTSSSGSSSSGEVPYCDEGVAVASSSGSSGLDINGMPTAAAKDKVGSRCRMVFDYDIPYHHGMMSSMCR
eukprot:GHUV01048014.1.p1 GENE.GHUV01048014.1~~GHUV01048014.1.p1  ORF type:complete len:105 (-),score=29.40 GHUV01048014.1:122-436(-)